MAGDDEGFLARWSRRKREAETKTPAALERTTAPEALDHPPMSEPPDVADIVAKLPPIEEITAATDIRAFLAPGVPAELRRAALRRAWSADPAIRDFIGLAENQWDFNAPDGVPGFGSLIDPDLVRRLLTKVVGGDDTVPERSAAESTAPDLPETQIATATEAPDPALGAEPTSRVMSEADSVSQPEADETPDQPRRHGGALPR